MNYNTDKPIVSGEEDLLGRLSFSSQLGKAIYNFKGKDGLVIGLFGKWGTGKTSVINMVENEINKIAENDKNKPLIMRFAPWNYSDKDNLISLFFQGLKNKIDVQDNEQLKNKVGKALSDYAGAFDALSVIPLFGSGAATILKTLAQVQGENLMQAADLDRTREILEKELLKVDKKIMVVIDDIDRLTNLQIRDVFQLVKQVADFPNIIYLLVMDRDIVRSALSEVHNIDGNEYLEKIIQVPFELPELRKTKLHHILFSKLDKTISELPNEVVWDERYWNTVFENCISPFIHNLRDVNRLINTFQFRFGMLHQETSFEDMLAITTLEVLEPELYKWIGRNKDTVCGSFMHSFTINTHNKSDYRKLYHDEFLAMSLDPEMAIKCISTLFPSFAKNVNEVQYTYQQVSDLRGKMRVAHEEKFDLYFVFDLDDIKVSRSVINTFIFELKLDELKKVIEEINNRGDILYFLDEIKSLIDEIPYDRLGLLASVIVEVFSEFEGEDFNSIFSISAPDKAEYLVTDIFKKIKTEEERFRVIVALLENVKKNNLGVIAAFINRIELAYGRLAAKSENKDNQIISLVHLEELEGLYLNKIHDIASSQTIFDIYGFAIAFYLWECFDKASAANYLKKMFNTELNKLKFICAIAGICRSTAGKGWVFDLSRYSEHISPGEIFDEIQNFNKENLDEFTEVEQIKLASFVLDYHNDDSEHINELKARELVKRWRNEHLE
ncbi:KAP family P-loop NTPase fold protein [Streptococcus pluranimalium]|uniref:KAP family P-loop NTPase fold protein n=1 Tax=Streptococcus pluranimalium TaxID=82348 RepID=UPI003BF8FEFA